MREHLDDGFDTPGALAVLFQFIREQNRTEEPAGPSALRLIENVDKLFGAFELTGTVQPDSEVEGLVEERDQMRAEKRFAEADAIRDRLTEQGITLEDSSDGTRWWRDTP
ncbi:hypothetical protein JG491_17260 [Streptomyces sp. CRPSP2-6A1]|uniref:CysS/YqeB C-terminal domain-containing protein n=1 Tax=Streptomyces TaxID=1883 RepID=UPI0018F07283|nr:DALR domain-containing protein [Streptomyces sp. CRPSP2-6A1]MBJ7001802.1 hypothetical protein [Streptomyces sp. CRPSP2-6A1]